MSLSKSNAFLDAGDSEDDVEQGYDSEADEIQKGAGARSAKRRRLSNDDEDDASLDGGAPLGAASDDDEEELGGDLGTDEEEEDDEEKSKFANTRKPTKASTGTQDLPDISRPLNKKNLVATEKAVKKSGLVYISRVPPFMKPAKVRSLLEAYGTINRVFLSPEDPAAHTRRVKAGGNKKRSFVDGWVEFTNKKDAKNVVALLNARTIGGPKNSYYRDDIWSLVYLKGFKWHNLTEQIASEAAERTSRMRAEIGKATRENKEFVRNIERAKTLDGMEAKAAAKSKRKRDERFAGLETGDGEDGEDPAGRKGKRQFKQSAVRDRAAEERKAPDDTKRVLSKLF